MAAGNCETPGSLPVIDRRVGMLVGATLAVLIALTEIDHLIGQVLDGTQVHSVTNLTSTGLFGAGDGWASLSGPGREIEPRLGTWLAAYGLLDLCFTALYGGALLSAVRRLPSRAAAARELPGAPWGVGRFWPQLFLAVGVGADLLENVLITLGGRWAPVLQAASLVKWLGLAVGIVWLLRAALALRRLEDRTPARGRIRDWLAGLYTHRYSLLVVAPLAALGLARGPDLLEQVPDIQRRWVDSGDWGSAVAAGVVAAGLVAATFAIGRLRSHHIWQRCAGDDGGGWPRRAPLVPRGAARPPEEAPRVGRAASGGELPGAGRVASVSRPAPPLWPWFGAAGLMIAAAGLARAAGMEVTWAALVVVVPLVIGGVSWCIRRVGGAPRPGRGRVTHSRFRRTVLAGDLLPICLIVVFSLGAVRSFAGVVALGGASVGAWLVLAGGVAGVIGCWHPYCWFLARVADLGAGGPGRRRWWHHLASALTPGHEPTARIPWLPWAILGVSLIGILVVALLPGVVAALGVIAAFQLGLGLIAIALASIVVALQPSGSPEFFWPLPFRLPFVPVTTLAVGVALIAGMLSGAGPVHRVRAVGDLPGRPGVEQVLDRWLTDGRECAAPVMLSVPEGGSARVPVRPLLLYAAEGGGIRAAYWTALGVDRIATAAQTAGAGTVCGSAFLSSGASGGAVGLTVASVTRPGEATAAASRLASQRALGEATVGLVTRDLIYAASGVPVPDLGSDSPLTWRDRAALIEDTWTDRIPELEDPWVAPRPAWSDWGPAGALVLNSTSATNGCRALVSQVSLPAGSLLRCGGDPERIAGSLDIVECTRQTSAATAALLSARFPFVTPAGGVDCPAADAAAGPVHQQLVDGGYAENTGIGTQVDLAEHWLPALRRHNERALRLAGLGPSASPADSSDPPPAREPEPRAGGLADPERTVVVPVLVYFDNGTGSDLLRRPPRSRLEILVPAVTYATAAASLYSADSHLQRAEGVFGPAAVGLAPVAESVDAWRGHTSYVVYQETKPSVTAPLGWVMSQASMDTMDKAIGSQQLQPGAYGSLPDLLRLVSTPPAGP